MNSGNKIGVLVVNLNNLNFTKKCIRDLQEQTNQNFKIYLFDQNSDEEGTSEYLSECKENGIRINQNCSNIPLIRIWNFFKDICNSDYLCFLNNDVELSNNFIDDTIQIFEKEPTVGIVVHITNNPKYLIAKKELEYRIFDKPLRQGWDFTIRRGIMPEIHPKLQLFYGDDYLFSKIDAMGYKVAIALSSPIIHYLSQTCVQIPNLNEIADQELLVYSKIMRTERLKAINSTCGKINKNRKIVSSSDSLCKLKPEQGMKITTQLKVLVVIVNYGVDQLNYLNTVIDELKSINKDRYIIDIFVYTNVSINRDDVTTILYTKPSEKGWNWLPWECRKPIYEKRDEYDLFLYNENDHLYTEKHFDSFIKVTKVLSENLIAGFIQYEEYPEPDTRRFYPAYHADYDWDFNSVQKIDDYTIACFGNEHQGSFLLTKFHLNKIIENMGEGFIKDEGHGYDSPKVRACTDVYVHGGMKKIIPVSHFKEFLVHHLPNKYINLVCVQGKWVTIGTDSNSNHERMEESINKIMLMAKYKVVLD